MTIVTDSVRLPEGNVPLSGLLTIGVLLLRIFSTDDLEAIEETVAILSDPAAMRK